jgi:hypothetical protein
VIQAPALWRISAEPAFPALGTHNRASDPTMSRRFTTVILRGRNELQALSALVISRQENPLNPGGSEKHEAEIDGWTKEQCSTS